MNRYALLVLLFCVPVVSGLGVSPAKSDFVGAPIDTSFTLRLFNHNPEPINLRVSATGDVTPFLQPSATRITIPGGGDTTTTIRVLVPERALPGVYTGGVMIEQLAPQHTGSGVVSVAAVKHKVTVTVPKQGKFLRAAILSSAPSVNQPVVLSVIPENIGTLPINELYADVTVTDNNLYALFERRTATKSLGVAQKTTLDTEWIPEEQGVYEITADIQYDEYTLRINRTLTVGTLTLLLGTPTFGDRTAGEVLRIDLPVTSEWNQPLKNINTAFTATNGARTRTFEGLPTTIPAYETTDVTAYWDTEGLSPGPYNLTATVYYGNTLSTRTYPVTLTEEGISLEEERTSRWWIYVLILVLLAALWYWVLRKNPPPEEETTTDDEAVEPVDEEELP